MWQMNPGALQAALEELEHAARDHAHWCDDLVRTIVCRLPCGPDDLAADAHRRCRFGRWYYEQAAAGLREDPVFQTMEGEHRRAHAAAQLLLRDASLGMPIDSDDYDALVTANASLRIELGSLRHELQAALRSCDPLTGAYGRASLLPELREWRELARRNVQPCCVVFMDLDHLKEINDRCGHAVGDQVLASAVRYVVSHLRPYDKVFRYGGDEFLITLPSTDLPTGLHLIGRIRTDFGRTPFVIAADGETVYATASFGVALLEPDLCVEESIDRADKALLLAKAGGRDRVIGWEPSITTGTILNWSAHDDPSAP